MQDAIENETLANNHFDVDFDSLQVDKLIDTIAGFNDWKEGWFHMYHHYVENTLSEDEKVMYEAQMVIISNIASKHPEYDHSQLSVTFEKIPDMISEFEKSLEKSIEKKAELQDEIEVLESDLSTLERELEHAEGEDADFVKDETDTIQNKINELQARIDNYVFDDATNILNDLEAISGTFGNPMQYHFTELRREINNFKTIIKADLMILNRKGESNAVLTYPADYLKEQLYGHGREDVTVVAACEETFIERVIKMETAREQMSEEDRKVLFEQKDISLAVKRFKDDYPEYEQVLWFSSKRDALTLSKREFISLDCLINVGISNITRQHELCLGLDRAV